MSALATRLAISCTIVSLLAICGCGGDGRVNVSGRVTLNGTPIETGSIEFLPVEDKGPTVGAVITDGRYRVSVAQGKKKVRIVGYRKVGTQHAIASDPTSPIVATNESIVPEEFNSRSELTASIESDASELNFDLRTDGG